MRTCEGNARVGDMSVEFIFRQVLCETLPEAGLPRRYIHMHTHMHMHTDTHAQVHTHAYTQYICTHAYTYTHTRTVYLIIKGYMYEYMIIHFLRCCQGTMFKVTTAWPSLSSVSSQIMF